MVGRLPFNHIVLIDFEFEFGGHTTLEEAGRSGERPRPVCMIAKELPSGRTWRLWRDEFVSQPPFPIGADTVLVAYYASAELGCFKALGWQPPVYVLDLFTEFRSRTNGLSLPNGAGLIGALTFFGIDGISITEKHDLRARILSGGPWSADDRAAILKYCESDVLALERLLPEMLARLDFPRALLRGRFMKAAAAIEWNGTPIDTATLGLLRHDWTEIQDNLIAVALSEMRLGDLAVGSDGRNRTILSAFRSRTGRCQPSNTKYIFGPSVWLRNLIQPPDGYGIAYIDWCQQEHGIAAALAGDSAMQAAYLSGDPYLEFAKQAGAVPAGATKHSHGPTRELFKQCALAVAYGMEAEALARRIGQPPIVARSPASSPRNL
jgi:hypothetical protein